MLYTKKQRNIVVIGGGTGTYTVLTGLKKYPVKLTAIVSMADDGGSTRILREEFGTLPPGSVRPALVALSEAEKSLADLFNFRFSEGTLRGHNFGNLFITALAHQLGSFEKALQELEKILRLKGRVIPSTLEDIRLRALLEDGTVIKGESNIDVPKHDGHLSIKKVWIEPRVTANPRALDAIRKAHVVVIGPGDIFSSIIPNFLVEGISKTLQHSQGKKVYVCNLMTKFGETTNFLASDFISTIQTYIGKDTLDYVVVNTKKPSPQRVKRYEKERAEFVEYHPQDFKREKFKVIAGNFLRIKGFIRHDQDKLAQILCKL